MLKNLLNFLCDIAHNKSLYVTTSFDYITIDWDRLFKEALDQIYLGLDFTNI